MSAPSNQSASHPTSSLLVSFLAVLGSFLLFALILYWAYLPSRRAAVTVDISQVDEAARWKYSDDGRAQKLAEVRGKSTEALGSYGWVDQQAGVIRLPIARAKELLVQEHARSGN